MCWLEKVQSLIYARENWCLLARAINLQLEVNDKGKKKASWHSGTELLVLCGVAPEQLLPFCVPGKAGEFLTGHNPGVSFGGLRRTLLSPPAHPGKSQPQISHLLCCCGFFRVGLVQDGVVLGFSSRGGTWALNSHCGFGKGGEGKMNPLALTLCWVWPQIPSLALAECTETLSVELLLPGLSSCPNFTVPCPSLPWINQLLTVREGFPLLTLLWAPSSSVLQFGHFWGLWHYTKSATVSFWRGSKWQLSEYLHNVGTSSLYWNLKDAA